MPVVMTEHSSKSENAVINVIITATARSSARRGHVIYQHVSSSLPLGNKVILIRRFLPTHIPAGTLVRHCHLAHEGWD